MAYRGSKSRNSIIGNEIRRRLSNKAVNGIPFLLKKRGAKEVEGHVKKVSNGEIKGEMVDPLTVGGQRAFYSPLGSMEPTSREEADRILNTAAEGKPDLSRGEIKVTPGRSVDPIINHELGHYKSMKNPKSFNSKLLKTRAENLKSPYPKHDGEEMREGLIRAEREAWIEGRKIKGKNKEKYSDKLLRKVALNTYERGLEAESQSERFRTDKKYRNQMLARTGAKVAGAAGGAYLGSKMAKYLNKKDSEELQSLMRKKSYTEKEKKRLKYLRRKMRAKEIALTAGGAIGGYATAKRLTRNLVK